MCIRFHHLSSICLPFDLLLIIASSPLSLYFSSFPLSLHLVFISMDHPCHCPSPPTPVIHCLPSTSFSFSSPRRPLPLMYLLNSTSPCLPPPPFCSWRSSWRGGAASAVLFLRTVLLAQNTDGYYEAAHKLIMLEINCCCQRQPPTCPSVSLCPLMHRIQLMDQMFAQCAAPFKVSTKVVWGLSDLRLFVLSVCALLPLHMFGKQNGSL